MKQIRICTICDKEKNIQGWRKGDICSSCYNNVVFKEKHGITYSQYNYRKNIEQNREKANKYRKENIHEARDRWKRYARSLRGQFTTSKNKANKLNKEWSLTFEQYCELRQGNCHYCNGDLPETSRGLDRKDSSIGYTINNCVPCCGYCNEIKGQNISELEMIEIIKLLKRLRKTDILWTK